MSTPSRAPADPALRLLDVFPAFERAFARWAQARLGDCGGVSSPARMRLLGVLHCKGPQIMSGLSDALGVTPRNVTTLVDALEGEGLVRRLAVPTDRRATLVELTPLGLERATAALAPFHEKLAEPFRDLSKKDQRELLRLMERLLDALHRRERGDGC